MSERKKTQVSSGFYKFRNILRTFFFTVKVAGVHVVSDGVEVFRSFTLVAKPQCKDYVDGKHLPLCLSHSNVCVVYFEWRRQGTTTPQRLPAASTATDDLWRTPQDAAVLL